MVPMPAQLGVQFAPGTMLGRYELLATIGTGGMASVILARQRGPAGFEKVVVIKVVHPHHAQDPHAVTMLLDEAKLAAQIDHPNVVHTYELGEAYGTFYIVMEYLAGESLAQVLKVAHRTQHPLTPFMAGKIVADAAEGLHFAHELRDFRGKHLGIVHRDVSPGNIVVQYNGGVKVVDFGIAKAEGRVTSTQEGELKGKFGYMPPEQIKNEAMDRRSDVFSLGVVLWESLAQRRLFHADNVAATLMQVLTGDRIPPSHYFPAIPHALDIACLRALAPDPADRFQTIAEMKQAIDDAIWQARIGTKEIEQYMATLFGDRMATRHQLMRRATVEMLSVGDLEQLGTAFREPVSEHQRPHSGEISVPDVALAATALATPPAQVRPSYSALPVAPRDTPLPPHLQAASPAYDITPPPPRLMPPIGMPIARPTLGDLRYQVGPVMLGEPPVSATERSSKTIAILLSAVLLGVGIGLFFALRHRGDPPAPATPVAKDTTLVLDPSTLPTAPSRRTAPAAAPPAPTPPPAPAPPAPPPTGATERAEPTEKTVARPVAPRPATPRPPKHKAAAQVVAEAHTDLPDAAELYKEAAEAHMAGDLAAAEAGYKKAIQANRGYAPPYRGLGVLYQASGNKRKAIEALKMYLKLSPSAKDGASVRNRIEQMGGS